MALANARLGDISTVTIKKAIRNNAIICINVDPKDMDRKDVPRCKVCIEANMRHKDVPQRRTRVNLRPSQTIGSDLQTIETRSYDGKHYLAIYADQATGALATVSLATKDQQVDVMGDVLTRFEAMSGYRIDTFRSDQGGEYTSKKVKELLSERGIKHEFNDTDRAFQNGLAETFGGKIVKMMRAARIRSGVPRKYWTENARHQT